MEVTLQWDPPLEGVVVDYLILVTELTTGTSRQLRSSNTSVSVALSTVGEYLAEVLATNCTGDSEGNTSISFTVAGGRYTALS